jgi:hypothetical protein
MQYNNKKTNYTILEKAKKSRKRYKKVKSIKINVYYIFVHM